MKIEQISVPEVYTQESADFRFFLKWFVLCLSKVNYDIENGYDLYDPLRCPTWLLWMLADTVGFKYDSRLCTAFNRLVLVYFMSMIRNRGSRDGVTLAAEVNLAQFRINSAGADNEINYERLDDTSIPVNSAYVTPHTDEGYIDVVYFSTQRPIDACIEYVRPIGMYLFQHEGVRFDSRTKISIDARLTNTNDIGTSIGPTHIGHYRRDDYARLQREPVAQDSRNPVYYRNKVYEDTPTTQINPGYRALYSLQMSNNEQVVANLLNPVFGLGYESSVLADNQSIPEYQHSGSNRTKDVNLRYDLEYDMSIGEGVYTIDSVRESSIYLGRPSVNPVMQKVGDAISVDSANSKFTRILDDGSITVDNYS